MLRFAVLADLFCSLGINRTFPLCIPVQHTACVCHLVVNLSCAPHALGNVCRMRRNFRCNDALPDILHIRKCQMLRRCHIAQKCSSILRGDRSSDRGSDMVVPRGNVRYQRSQYIKRCSHADRLLNLHIRCNLIHRHVPRSLYHDLHISCPGALCKLAQPHQFLNLTHIGRIRQTARSAGIAQRDRHIMLPADLKNLIVILVKRILLSGHTHPRKHQ